MTKTARGSFEVMLAPLALHEAMVGENFGRLSISKQFTGDLAGSSAGEMLSARTTEPTSAGYVAIEHVTGTLAGKTGSFVLQHSSTLAQGDATQSITVVPDSGTDELIGLIGSMIIHNEAGQHSYEFTYTLPA